MPEEFPLEAFLGGEIAGEDQAVQGMRRAEDEQTRRFEARRDSHGESLRAMRPLQESFGEQMSDRLAEAVKGLQEVEGRHAQETLPEPELPKEQQRIFPGSVGVTRVPPYNYQWTWNAQDGGAVANVAANAGSGQESFFLYNNSNSAHAWGTTAVGVYFRPIFNGFLHVWANPAFNYSWFTYSVFDSSHSDGWIGLYAGQYNLAGDMDRVAVDQQISLWWDDSWWAGAGSHNGSNSGYPLSAWFTVDTSHWYAIWVRSGGSVFGDGWGSPFWGSGAGASLNVGVPSISMVLY